MIRRLLPMLVLTLGISFAADAAPLQRTPVDKSSVIQGLTPAPSGLVIVKFQESSGLTLTDDNRLVGPFLSRERLEAVITTTAPGARLERRFKRPATELAVERRKSVERTGANLPDLTSWAEFDPGLGQDDLDGLVRIVKELLADPDIETAFLEPRMVPAALGFDAFTGRFTPPIHDGNATALGPDKTTPDFSPLQGYKDNVQGVHALAVAGFPGADGADVQVIDIEGAWLWSHEDLPAPMHESGGQFDDLSWRNHGTAVLGVIRGSDNGIGVTGIAQACAVGAASITGQSLPNALSVAAVNLTAGDVILIELHAPGPNADGTGQFGYVAMEYWQDNFDAIQAATALGRIVVEAAGNGQQDFDDPVYAQLFDPTFRHSGAIIVGAGNAANVPEWFTNHGVRVDLNGWGSNVVTLGYGNLQGDPLPESEWYTQSFSGTSSASPIVVGSVVSLQGMVKSQLSTVLDASLMRDMLHDTGTAQVPDPWLIGPRPNIDAAWMVVQAGLGVVSGTVTSAGSGAPLAGALVEVQGSTRSTTTDAAGGYTMGMPVGPVTLDFSEYFHVDASTGLTVTAGVTTTGDIALTALPTVALAGRVVPSVPLSIAGARISPLGVPLTGSSAAGDGSWTIAGVPVGKAMNLLIDGIPYFGADFLTVTPFDAGGGLYPVISELRFTTQSFASAGGWTTLGAPWTWGTPSTGPAAGFSPPACWGVGMNANYNDATSGTLASTTMTFWTGEQLHLSFHYWSRLEAGWDGVQLRVVDGVDFTILEPLEGYSHVSLPGLGNTPGWSGDSGGWQGTVFDLTDWIGRPITLSFRFGSDESVNDIGFFLDDVTFDTGDTIVGIDELGPPPGGGIIVSTHPNPFNPSTTVLWRTDAPGRIRVVVHDTRGRTIRTLSNEDTAATSGTIRWDGRDDAGQTVATGTYLVRVVDGSGSAATSRVTLVR